MTSRRPKVVYVVSRFPKLTETFVVNEWWRVREHVDLGFAALLREREEKVHPAAERLLPDVRFLPLASAATARANLRRLARSPRRYLTTLLSILVRSPRTHSGGRLKGLVTFAKAVLLAEHAEQVGATHVHAHFINQPATAAWVVHRLAGIPFSVTAHANDLFAGPALLAEKVREASFVACISRYNERFIRERVPAGGRIEIVHCGVDLERFPFRLREEVSRLACVARLYDTKGHDDLLRAFAALGVAGGGLELDLVGDGPERPRLERLAHELGVAERVRFLGGLPTDDVREVLDKAGLFALAAVPHPSGAMDGIPVALMEAMAAGIPVVATALSGIPELVRDGETGLLVPPSAPAELAEALRRLVVDERLGQLWKARNDVNDLRPP
jgi:colanic acid/amylovoran biosynthesis glycosyltransferase